MSDTSAPGSDPKSNTGSSLEARIAELEIENAYQRETIDSLNQTVTEQWRETTRISKMLEQIIKHLQIQEPGADSSGNEPPPPHY